MTAPASPTDAAVETMVVRPRDTLGLGYAWIDATNAEQIRVDDIAGIITVGVGRIDIHVTAVQLKELFDRAGVVLMAREGDREASAA